MSRIRIALAFFFASPFTAAALADAKNPTYVDDVLPVLRQSCVSCHGDDKQKGGLNLASFANMQQGGSSGAVVAAGDPDKSRLYLLMAHIDEPKMPPKADKLPDAQLNLMRLWIEQGARENAAGKVMAPAKKAEVALKVSSRGKPDGPPPMPKDNALSLEPATHGRRSGAILALAASPWAPLVAVGGPREILYYHGDTGDLLGVLPFPPGQVNSLKFSRNGKLLVAAGGRGGQAGRAVLFDVESGKPVSEIGTETDALLAADLSADQSQVAVGGPSKIVRCYSTADGSVLHEIKKHTDWVTAVEFSPDGVLLASADRNGGLFVWEAGTGREFYTLKGPRAAVTDLSWRSDGNVLAVASEDGAVYLYEMQNGRQIKTWAAHGGGASSVRFAPDGTLATTGRDRMAKYWDAGGNLKKQFKPFPDLGLRVAITHDGSKVIAGDWSGQVKVWTVTDGRVVAALDANPPSFAGQVTRAVESVKAAEAAFAAAKTAHSTAEALVTSATGTVVAAQKVVSELNLAVQSTTNSVGLLKSESEKAAAAASLAANIVAAREVVAGAYLDAAKKIRDAAAKAPQNSELASVAKKSDETAKVASDDLTSAKIAFADAQANAARLAAKMSETQKAAGAKSSEVAEAQKRLTAAQAALRSAQENMAKAKTTVQSAEAMLLAVRARADRLIRIQSSNK